MWVRRRKYLKSIVTDGGAKKLMELQLRIGFMGSGVWFGVQKCRLQRENNGLCGRKGFLLRSK